MANDDQDPKNPADHLEGYEPLSLINPPADLLRREPPKPSYPAVQGEGLRQEGDTLHLEPREGATIHVPLPGRVTPLSSPAPGVTHPLTGVYTTEPVILVTEIDPSVPAELLRPFVAAPKAVPQHITCTRVLAIDCGHRLRKHDGPCRRAHGHRYSIELTCAATGLDEVGRVIDYGVIKEKVGGWLNNTLDHRMILEVDDPMIAGMVAGLRPDEPEAVRNEAVRLTNLAVRTGTINLGVLEDEIVVVPFSPTSENLVVFVAENANRLLAPHGVKVIHVKLWETPNCYAEWSARPRTTG